MRRPAAVLAFGLAVCSGVGEAPARAHDYDFEPTAWAELRLDVIAPLAHPLPPTQWGLDLQITVLPAVTLGPTLRAGDTRVEVGNSAAWAYGLGLSGAFWLDGLAFSDSWVIWPSVELASFSGSSVPSGESLLGKLDARQAKLLAGFHIRFAPPITLSMGVGARYRFKDSSVTSLPSGATEGYARRLSLASELMLGWEF